MPKAIYLVKVGMSMTEGMVAEWYIPDGGAVKKGELVYSLETEKVSLDVDAEHDGIVRHLISTGVSCGPGDVVGYIFEAGEAIPDNLDNLDKAPTPDLPPSVAKDNKPVVQSSSTTETSDTTQSWVKSSPAARRLARELGVDYRQLTGSGPGGRVVVADVQTAAESATAGTSITQTSEPEDPIVGDKIPLRGMRKIIASRMQQSLQHSAQLTMDMEAIMDDAVKVRNSLVDEWAAEGIKPSFTDLVIFAAAKALRKHPLMNSQLIDNEILLSKTVDIGMAVALPEGLVVPVIRDASNLSLKQLATESSRLALAARENKLVPDDFTGGSFTVSALGMYGVGSFTPIINTPQTGILGINRLYEGIEWDGDKPVKTKKMNLSLTWDHRVLDGAPAAEFLAEVCKLLTEPWRLLV